MRSLLSVRKAGHAGTLDPQAEGLLVLAFGKATRLIRYLPLEPKVYEFTIQFGTQTDTLDAEGTVTISGLPYPSVEDLTALLPSFRGSQMQVPPAYSALKVGGKRAYDLARKGTPPDLQARSINVENLVLLKYDTDAGRATVSVTCSGGSYVRAFARDIAEKLGTSGFAASIRRTRCGNFNLADALKPEQVDNTVQLTTPAEVFASLPAVQATEEMANAVTYGRDLYLNPRSVDAAERVMLFRGSEMVAVLAKKGECFHPELVLANPAEGDHANP